MRVLSAITFTACYTLVWKLSRYFEASKINKVSLKAGPLTGTIELFRDPLIHGVPVADFVACFLADEHRTIHHTQPQIIIDLKQIPLSYP
jgi:hypothetical protein